MFMYTYSQRLCNGMGVSFVKRHIKPGCPREIVKVVYYASVAGRAAQLLLWLY